MKTTFCRAITKDELRLDGLLFEPDTDTQACILHVHGRAGNFYANTFLDAMIREYTHAGCAFLSVNTRAHDHVADFRIGRTENLRRLGAVFDVFEECIFDIDAWLEFIRAKGYKKIILQGHSQGGCKIIYYLSKKPQIDIAAVVLASPADAAGLLKKYSSQQFKENLKMAQGMVDQGRGEELLPQKVRDFYYVSAKTFVDEFGSTSPANIFPIYENGAFKELESIEFPILAFYGSSEDTLVYSAKKDLDIIKAHLKNPKSQTVIIEGAAHTYLNFENQIANQVAGWLREII